MNRPRERARREPATPATPARHANARERAAALKAALPEALRLLMSRQGAPSLRAASRQIGEVTGSTLTPMALSLWLRGQSVPSFDSLVEFLIGHGLELRDLASAVDEVVARRAREADALAVEIARRMREDAGLERRLTSLLATADGDGKRRPKAGRRRKSA